MNVDRYVTRRERLRRDLENDGVPAAFVTGASNVRYLTGFSGSNGTVYVGPGRDVLATDGRYADQAAAENPGIELVVGRGDGWLRQVTDGLDVLGVVGDQLSLNRADQIRSLLDEVRLEDVGAHLTAQRARKDEHELEAIRRACTITAEAVEAMYGWLGPGVTERAAAHRLLGEMLERGADRDAFEFIVASGPNGARPHHRPTDRRLVAGELVTFDVGACVDGYRADMTRTVALGRPGREPLEMYNLVRAAQQAGVAAVADGVAAAAVDAACREVIAAGGRADQFVHPAGHGLGLDVHEEPILRAAPLVHTGPANDRPPPPRGAAPGGELATLRTRMTVTVEPGVYLAGVGGVRIEDVVVVTDGGCDVLTATSRDLIVL